MVDRLANSRSTCWSMHMLRRKDFDTLNAAWIFEVEGQSSEGMPEETLWRRVKEVCLRRVCDLLGELYYWSQ